MFFTIHKINPKSVMAQLAAEGAYVTSGEQSIYVMARKASNVEVFGSSDSGFSWNSLGTVAGEDIAKGENFNLSPSITHVHFVSDTSKIVKVFPLSAGLSLDSVQNKPIMVGDAISVTEKASVDARMSDLESLSLQARTSYTFDTAAVTGQSVSTGMSGIADKNFMLFVNGSVVHPDDFTLNPADDGNMTFAFNIEAASELFCMVWE